MSNIKFHLVKLDKKVLFQIIEQAESISHKVTFVERSSDPKDYWIVASSGEPEIKFNTGCTYDYGFEKPQNNVLYLRGNSKSKDFAIITLNFNTNVERDEAYNSIHYVLKKAFENTENWKNI